MTDSDRNHFDQGLDALAKILRLQSLESDVKFGYFKALRHFKIEAFFEGCQKLTETYRPRRKDDFPVPAVFAEAIGGVVKPEEPQSRTYEEIKASYRRRGILIGQEADESWDAVATSVLGEEPF